ncbi:MAG: peptidoglycan-binding protein [Myxococcota bacterium]
MALLRSDSVSRSRIVRPVVLPRPTPVAVKQVATQQVSSFQGPVKANTLVSPPPTRFVDPNADALLGLKRGDRRVGDDRRIEQLHQDLIQLGYVKPDFVKDVGYGKQFGPITELAVRKFQADQGIPQSGMIDERTVAALAGRPVPPPPAVENASELVGLTKWDAAKAGDTRIARLHQNLMDRGYLPPNFKSNSGFGKNFGPMTEQAVEKFQRDWGLTPSGSIDAATAAALGSHGVPPAPEFRGAWAGHVELGGATGPAVKHTDGSLSQSFERGTLTRAADGTITVADLSGITLERRATGTVSTTEAANAFFVNQEGNTEYFQSFNGNAKPYGANDCGPTSAVMALAALGLAERPSATEAPHAIDAMRDAIFKYDTSKSSTMGMYSVEQGLKAYGADTKTLDVRKATKDGAGLEAIDAALAAGHPVILGGTPGEAWAKELDKTGDYLDMGARGNGSFGHFVAVLGKTDDGKYLLADPLSRKGTIEVSASQIGTFLKQSGWGEAIEVFAAGQP